MPYNKKTTTDFCTLEEIRERKDALLDEIQKEAIRQDRTVSWIVQRAWKIARDEILLYPSINDPSGDEVQGLISPPNHSADEN